MILFNKQGVKDTVVGEADFQLSDLTTNTPWKEWHALGDDKGKAKILLEIHLVTDAVRHVLIAGSVPWNSPIRMSRTFRLQSTVCGLV